MPDSVVVRVLDQFGNGVPNVTVTWQVLVGGGTLALSTTTTSASGHSATRWFLGPRLDVTQTLRATVSGLPALTFSATPTFPAGVTLTKIGGDAQTGTAASTLPDSLVARVALADGRPTQGVNVYWTPSNGIIPAIVALTGADGRVATRFTLGSTVGSATLTTTVSGVQPVNFTETVTAPPSPIAFAVATGGNHRCAIVTSAGAARCSGSNTFGQLGDGTTTSRSAPANVNGGYTFSSIIAGVQGSCGVYNGGVTQAYCWGDWNTGWVSGPKIPASTGPTAFGNQDTQKIAGEYAHVCILRNGGSVNCAGGNESGQLGNGTRNFSTSPGFVIQGGVLFTDIAVGVLHSCALSTTSVVYCWGSNLQGQRADPATAGESTTPVATVGQLPFASVVAGYYHTCALTSAGAAYCWGANTYEQIGNGANADRYAPTAVSGGLIFSTLSAFGNTTCGVTTAGAAYCWGDNNNRQLGDGTNASRNVPTAVAGGLVFDAISVGAISTCARSTNGRAYCWDSGTAGTPTLMWP